jgi:tubulin polyglutamylase TTLL2
MAVVQSYIENPLLIGGYKFDLRLYVCVPSYQPLTIYLYKHGIVRFATEKFSLESIDDSFRHLTNFSLNKLGPGYNEKKERVGAGNRFFFSTFTIYLFHFLIIIKLIPIYKKFKRKILKGNSKLTIIYKKY